MRYLIPVYKKFLTFLQIAIWPLVSLLIILFFSSPLFAVDAFLISDYGASARLIGIGNIEGFSTSSEAVFENPASLFRVDNMSISAFQTSLVEDIKLSAYSTVFNISQDTKLGFGILSYGVGDIKVTGINNSTGRFFTKSKTSFNDAVYKLVYGSKLFKDIYFGSAFSYFKKDFASISGQGFNLDVGIFIDSDIDISLSAKNIVPLSKMNYSEGESETLPLQYLAGLQIPFGDFDLFAQVKMQAISKEYLKSIGLVYSPSWVNDLLYISSGFKEIDIVGIIKNNISIGLGLKLAFFETHFSFEKSDYIGRDNKYYFSTSINF